jgi:hypothetical protein
MFAAARALGSVSRAAFSWKPVSETSDSLVFFKLRFEVLTD